MPRCVPRLLPVEQQRLMPAASFRGPAAAPALPLAPRQLGAKAWRGEESAGCTGTHCCSSSAGCRHEHGAAGPTTAATHSRACSSTPTTSSTVRRPPLEAALAGVAAAGVVLAPLLAGPAAALAEAASSAGEGTAALFSPSEPGFEVWVGFAAGVIPFAIGTYEFLKRIIIQQRCEVCGGRGLVPSAGAGRDKYLRKCPQCGGFFPWISWKMFLTSTATPGNGGPLLQPRGQSSVLYSVPDAPDAAKLAAARARVDDAIARNQMLQQQGQGQGQQGGAGAQGGEGIEAAGAVPVAGGGRQQQQDVPGGPGEA